MDDLGFKNAVLRSPKKTFFMVFFRIIQYLARSDPDHRLIIKILSSVPVHTFDLWDDAGDGQIFLSWGRSRA